MKFCKKCGTQLKDDAKFCIKCGQPTGEHSVNNYHPPINRADPVRNNKQAKGKKTWIGIVIGVLVVALIVLFIANPAMRMKGYEKPVYYITKFVESGDIKSLVKVFPLKQIAKFAKDNANDLLKESGLSFKGLDLGDYKEAIESINDIMEDYKDEIADEFGDDFKVEYEIRKAEEVDDLEDIQDKYDELDIDIKEAYELTIKMKMEGDEKTERETVTMQVVKIGSKWYLDIFNMF